MFDRYGFVTDRSLNVYLLALPSLEHLVILYLIQFESVGIMILSGVITLNTEIADITKSYTHRPTHKM